MGRPATEIAASLAAEIEAGRLPVGARLPTHRELAHSHGVALNTASRAMRLLAARGLVAGEVGRGSYVRTPGHVDAASFRFDTRRPGTIDMARNTMPLPGLADRFEAAARLVLRRERDGLADYQPHAGRDLDRAAGATWLSRSGHLPNEPARIVVCAGAQHATTVALMAVTRPGDVVAVEALTWPGIKASADMLGVELVPVPLDAGGLRPGALLRLAARRRIAALYCMPSLQNPTATVMPVTRREAVATLARRLDFQVIEDDAYSFLVRPEQPPVAALAPERTWFVRSTSKSMVPGLRTAWLLTPPGQQRRAADLVRATVWTAPPLGAAIASQWVADGTAALVEDEKRRQARLRWAIAARAFTTLVAPAQHPASMHIWLRLPRGRRAQQVASEAEALGVLISPAPAFAVRGAPSAVRLALGAPGDVRDLRRALDLLRQVLL